MGIKWLSLNIYRTTDLRNNSEESGECELQQIVIVTRFTFLT